MTECPHCKSHIHEGAVVCTGCGAMKGAIGPGFTHESLSVYIRRIVSLLGVALVLVLWGLGTESYLVAVPAGAFAIVMLPRLALFYFGLKRKEVWWR